MSRAERWLIALASFCVVAIFGYSLVRAFELALFPAANPAVIIWTERSAFLWRSAIAFYIGGMGAFGGYALAARAPAQAARWLSRAVPLAAAALLAQAALLP